MNLNFGKLNCFFKNNPNKTIQAELKQIYNKENKSVAKENQLCHFFKQKTTIELILHKTKYK